MGIRYYKKPGRIRGPRSAVFPPSYMNKGVKAPPPIGNTAESAGKSAKAVISIAKGFKDTAKGTIKTAKKSVKTSEQAAKQAVKTAQQAAKTAHKTAQASAKAAKTAERTARAATKAASQAAKAAARGITVMVKATIAAAKGLIAAVAAGGWVAVLVIVIICMIGLLAGSIIGIFFANEPNPDTGQTAGSVMVEIDAEYTSRIDNIIASNILDSLEMSGARASWKDMLAVYAVRMAANPDNPLAVAVMDDEKAEILRSVFWDMNAVDHWAESIEHSSSYIDDDGNEQTDTWTEYILHITVSRKTPEEMAAQYGFNDEQKKFLDELLKPEYISLWNALLYGVSGTGDIIFFDWEQDGECDHVGIVVSVADGKVNTVEGNSGDSCHRRSYDLGSVDIYGYGVPTYN